MTNGEEYTKTIIFNRDCVYKNSLYAQLFSDEKFYFHPSHTHVFNPLLQGLSPAKFSIQLDQGWVDLKLISLLVRKSGSGSHRWLLWLAIIDGYWDGLKI